MFLSWCYPPMAYPRATQVQRLATHLECRPLEVYCLAPTGNSDVRYVDAASGLDIVRIPRALLTRVVERLMPARRLRTLSEYDVKYLWWRDAARKIIATDPGPGDVLVTFGQPMVDHLAGLLIKRRTGVRWVAHFSDPWSDNPFDPKASAARPAEAEVLAKADRVVFTSPETVDLVMAKYPVNYRTRVHVIPHGFEPALFTREGPPPRAGRHIVARYLGNFYGHRGPDPLYRALDLALKWRPGLATQLRIEFVGGFEKGTARAPAKPLPDDMVRILPAVSYSESLRLMETADLLLVIDAPAQLSVFLPSKLVEYIGAGRPIVALVPPGAAARVVAEVGGIAADPSDVEASARALLSAVDRAGTTGSTSDARHRYSASTTAAALARVLAELTDSATSGDSSSPPLKTQ